MIRKSREKWDRDEVRTRIIEYVHDIAYKIKHGKFNEEFTEWDREYVDLLIWFYELGYDEFSKEDILECLGYDPDERHKLNSKLNSFRNRLKKYFSIEMDL